MASGAGVSILPIMIGRITPTEIVNHDQSNVGVLRGLWILLGEY